ncbi:hypothetical protein AOX55_00002423 [Sinorhizobium fredii CCBAU 25509]|nr:hypothetical protein AOX55_00002423 [Sinorhizobium fredii CCBAU 25509]
MAGLLDLCAGGPEGSPAFMSRQRHLLAFPRKCRLRAVFKSHKHIFMC